MRHEHVPEPVAPEAPAPVAAPIPRQVHAILALQRSAGNAAVARMLARQDESWEDWGGGTATAADLGADILAGKYDTATYKADGTGFEDAALDAELQKHGQRIGVDTTLAARHRGRERPRPEGRRLRRQARHRPAAVGRGLPGLPVERDGPAGDPGQAEDDDVGRRGQGRAAAAADLPHALDRGRAGLRPAVRGRADRARGRLRVQRGHQRIRRRRQGRRRLVRAGVEQRARRGDAEVRAAVQQAAAGCRSRSRATASTARPRSTTRPGSTTTGSRARARSSAA